MRAAHRDDGASRLKREGSPRAHLPLAPGLLDDGRLTCETRTLDWEDADPTSSEWVRRTRTCLSTRMRQWKGPRCPRQGGHSVRSFPGHLRVSVERGVPETVPPYGTSRNRFKARSLHGASVRFGMLARRTSPGTTTGSTQSTPKRLPGTGSLTLFEKEDKHGKPNPKVQVLFPTDLLRRHVWKRAR